MATDFKSIPIIDVSPLLKKFNDPKMDEDQGVLEVVGMLDKACKETGFFYVKGHGIPDSLVKDVRDTTRIFFSLSYEEKLKIKMSAETGFRIPSFCNCKLTFESRGYQRVGENVTKGKPDLHEAIDCYREIRPGMYGALGKTMEGCNLWPDNPPNFKHLMEEYVNLLADLARKIMGGIALALGGSPETFDGQRIGDDNFWVLRIIGYPASTEMKIQEIHDDGIGCGAHTDYGLLTLVNQDDDITALQVRNRSGEWIWAAPIPGTFVCNIGDMLKIFSNGLYESTLHRVVNNSPKYRVSIPFFLEPVYDAVVEPLDFCKEKTGGIAKFEKAIYGVHLVGKVTTNFDM